MPLSSAELERNEPGPPPSTPPSETLKTAASRRKRRGGSSRKGYGSGVSQRASCHHQKSDEQHDSGLPFSSQRKADTRDNDDDQVSNADEQAAQASQPLLLTQRCDLQKSSSKLSLNLKRANDSSVTQMRLPGTPLTSVLGFHRPIVSVDKNEKWCLAQEPLDREAPASSSSSCGGHGCSTYSSTSAESDHNYVVSIPLDGLRYNKCDTHRLKMETKSEKNLLKRQEQLVRSTSLSNCFLEEAQNVNYAPTSDGTSNLLDSFERQSQSGSISRSMLELDHSISGHEKFEIYWKNLTFSYKTSWTANLATKLGRNRTPTANRPVLNNLSGCIKSNQLVAIIGPSGCGKSTLLQFLAGNNPSWSNRLRVHGIAQPKVAFIGQDDGLLSGLTARETLMYASRLQNSAPNFDHAGHIQPILNELGLCECSDRSVSKLSGGQAKRVTIAQELLYPTNLLILDEVTSGLDASTSYSIIKLLKHLVSDSSYPMSIVMSIHQPSARLFSIFDQVYVMSDGCCLYEGSCNLDRINQYLGRFQLACPQFHNIADYLIELACCATVTVRDHKEQQAETPLDKRGSHTTGHQLALIKARMVESQRKQSEHAIERKAESQSHQTRSLFEAIDEARAARVRPMANQIASHFSRSLLRIRRSYILTWLQLATYIVLGLQISTFYGPDVGQMSGCPRLPANLMSYVLAPDDQLPDGDDELTLEIRRIQENMNLLLVAVLATTFAALEITVITFPMEAKTIKREWRNGWYRVSSYFMGRTLADLPFQLVFVVIFCLLVYSLTGQLGLSTWRFGYFLLVVVMTALIAQAFGFMFGALFMDNLPAAVFTAPLAIFPTLLFSGFFARTAQVPALYRPLTYVSHFRYAFDVLILALYGFDRCECDQEALTSYHGNQENQSRQMRDLFNLLFGASDCISAAAATNNPEYPEQVTSTSTLAPQESVSNLIHEGDDISHEDLAAIEASNSSLASQLVSMIRGASTSTTTAPPTTSLSSNLAHSMGSGAASSLKQLEDMLVESVFQQMAAPSRGEHNDSISSDQFASTNDTWSQPEGDGLSAIDRLAIRFNTKLSNIVNKQANFGHPMPSECSKFNSYLVTEFSLEDEDIVFGLAMLLLAVLSTRLVCNMILHFTIATRVR